MDKKTVDTLIKAGFWASVIVSLLLLVHYGVAEDKSCWIPEGCTVASSNAKPGITSAFTRNKNFVIALMPDPNTDAIFDSIMLCAGNVDDKEFDLCHDAIPFPEPPELRHGEVL